ncbi:MAG: Gfo/Idh/MocA family oxidoreductase [Bacteroidales bacterium]|nr:Gfo/Idh/MocA family oxidoreductase [Bacteroidales bacterium]
MKNTRREFVKTVSIGTIGTLGLGMAACTTDNAGKAAANHIWPSDKINIAYVGAAGKGANNINQQKNLGVNVVALCDVDWGDRVGAKFKEFPNANRYKDFRVMLDKEKDIDAVVVSTPDHTHGIATMAALDLGKHIYCEKPLAHSLNEVRMVTEKAREQGVMTQMGNQGHSYDTIREVYEIINAGIIGDVTEIIAWCDRPAGGGNVSFPHGIERPDGDFKVPKTFDWDLWLGPAENRPYHPAYAPQKWRGFIDFGCGALGDFGCHTLDPAFWALDLGSPDIIIASTTNLLPEVDYDTFPTSSVVEYRFPSRGKKPPVKLTWYDGGILPVQDDRFANIRFGTNGALLIGNKGMIMHGSHGAGGFKVLDKKGLEVEYTAPPQTIDRVEGHHIDWINAIRTGKAACSDFNYGGPLTETVLLGVVASMYRNQKVIWDAKNMKIANIEEANALLFPEFRKGWEI